MSFQADTRRHFELWRAEMLAAPDPVGCEQLTCPHCGDTLTVRWARSRRDYQVYHAISAWCMPHGAAWYGATRAEAIENFRGSVEGHAARVSPAVEEGLGLTPQSHPKGAFQEVPLKDRSGNQAPPPENSPPAGAATIAGWEVSGLSDEDVNALLTEKEGA